MAQLGQIKTVGLEHTFLVEYADGTTLSFWAGEPLDSDGNEIAPMGDKCVSMRIGGETEATTMFSADMALDIARGLWRSLWGMASWRERVGMIYDLIAVNAK